MLRVWLRARVPVIAPGVASCPSAGKPEARAEGIRIGFR